ncbi:MAG TPA: lysophospholipid acyltransferase family protein [Kineosporiaceae bacterium]|nr:lysophospholipid acyltransferase family protein [Kineosporiaceae bacterium]
MGYTLARWIVGFVFRVVWRPRVVGVENVPGTGPVIIASNHLSFIDSVVIPLAVPRRVRFLAKAEYFEGRGLRGRGRALFFRVIDAVPVERSGGGRESLQALESALGVLRAGEAFGIYPEGTRSRDGRLYRGRTGVGWLALTSGAPIVPVALTGTDEVQPVGSNGLRVRPVTIRFGPPVDPRAYAGLPAGRARREITDEVMDRIAALSPRMRVDAYNEPPGGDEVDTNAV